MHTHILRPRCKLEELHWWRMEEVVFQNCNNDFRLAVRTCSHQLELTAELTTQRRLQSLAGKI